jgi:hypothetical protein
MAKKWERMTKNQKLDTVRADIAKVLHAIEKLTRRVDAVILLTPKKAKAVRKRATVQTCPASLQPTPADQDEDEQAASISA